ncbi:hypothetical protein OC861_002401 [Tilletia horrida]|nr:hypothetical protein OC861_002401 [Tilletia horrida]
MINPQEITIDSARLIPYLAILGLAAYYIIWPLIRLVLAPYRGTATALKGPPAKHWLFGSFDADAYTQRKFDQYVLYTIEKYGPVCCITGMARQPILIVSDYCAINHVLLHQPYDRIKCGAELLRRHVGHGLLTESGATHRRQRRVASPAFSKAAVFGMSAILQQKADAVVERLRHQLAISDGKDGGTHGHRVDLARIFGAYALDVLGSAGFGYEFSALTGDEEISPLQAAVQKRMRLATSKTPYALLRLLGGSRVESLGRLFRIQEQAELDEATAVVHRVSRELVMHARMNANTDQKQSRDVLSLMVRANISESVRPSQRLSDEELMNMIPVLIVAGHETTSTSLAWGVWNLVKDKNSLLIQKRLREELSAELTSYGENWRSDAAILDRLPYLDGVVRETLRLHPPAPGLAREAPFDDVIPLSRPVKLRDGTMTDKIKISKGQAIDFCVIWLNTNKETWGDDGKNFKPERWLPASHKHFDKRLQIDERVKELQGVWSHLMTFGSGTQQCIGQRLAILEMKYVLAALVHSFELLPPNLPSEPPVKIVPVTHLVTQPVVAAERQKGFAMPVRFRAL